MKFAGSSNHKWRKFYVPPSLSRDLVEEQGREGVVGFTRPSAQSVCFYWISSMYGSSYPTHILNLYLVHPDVEFSSFLPLCFSPSVSGNSHFKFILFYHGRLLVGRENFFLPPAKIKSFVRVRNEFGADQARRQADQVKGCFQRTKCWGPEVRQWCWQWKWWGKNIFEVYVWEKFHGTGLSDWIDLGQRGTGEHDRREMWKGMVGDAGFCL